MDSKSICFWRKTVDPTNLGAVFDDFVSFIGNVVAPVTELVTIADSQDKVDRGKKREEIVRGGADPLFAAHRCVAHSIMTWRSMILVKAIGRLFEMSMLETLRSSGNARRRGQESSNLPAWYMR